MREHFEEDFGQRNISEHEQEESMLYMLEEAEFDDELCDEDNRHDT